MDIPLHSVSPPPNGNIFFEDHTLSSSKGRMGTENLIRRLKDNGCLGKGMNMSEILKAEIFALLYTLDKKDDPEYAMFALVLSQLYLEAE